MSFGADRFVAELFADTIDSITFTLAVVSLALSVAVSFAFNFASGTTLSLGVAGGVAGSVVLSVADVDLDVDADFSGGFDSAPFDGVVVVIVSASMIITSEFDTSAEIFRLNSVL